ncbi:MAG: hypothetical protein QOE63_1987 [Acidimicrobiaceae bacterium]
MARPDTLDEVLRHSLDHVRRSRLEPGCLLHSVHTDVEDPNRVVFIEHWADRGALLTHFGVPASNDFVRAVSELAGGPTTIEIYEAERIKL